MTAVTFFTVFPLIQVIVVFFATATWVGSETLTVGLGVGVLLKVGEGVSTGVGVGDGVGDGVCIIVGVGVGAITSTRFVSLMAPT